VTNGESSSRSASVRFPARYCAVKAFEEDIEVIIAKIAGEVVD